MNRKLASLGARRIAMVTPYTHDIHNRILDNYEKLTFSRPIDKDLGGTVSKEFASIFTSTIKDIVLNVARESSDVIMIICPNLKGAAMAKNLSKRLGISVIDSAVATFQVGSRFISGID